MLVVPHAEVLVTDAAHVLLEFFFQAEHTEHKLCFMHESINCMH